MKFSKTLFLALIVAAGTPAFAGSPDAPKVAAAVSPVKLTSFTGTIKIAKKDGTVVEVVSDGKTPPPVLNDGDQVTVVSGDAKLTLGGTTAALKANDSVSVIERNIKVVAGSVSFTNAKGTTVANAGDTVFVPAPASVSSTTGGNTGGTGSSKTSGSAQQEQQFVSPSAP